MPDGLLVMVPLPLPALPTERATACEAWGLNVAVQLLLAFRVTAPVPQPVPLQKLRKPQDNIPQTRAERDHVNRLVRDYGRLPIGDLTTELGWSRRRIASEFREQVGLPPKSAARLLRFERAKALLDRADLSLAEVALESGFYDQSHLSNEFRRITGATPAAYAAEPEQISKTP